MAGLLDFVLPAIFSAGDSAKRQIKGLLGDPVGTVKQFINNKNDEAAAHLADIKQSTQGRMAGLLGEQVTPEQLAADQRVNQALANGYNPAGMIVWHGSPHNFTKFDSSKIGTGEGAQAYGHGLYLAESPDVAKSYADSVSRLHGATTTVEGAGRKVPVPLWAADRVRNEGIDSLINEWSQRLAESQARAKTSLQPWIDQGNAARFMQQLEELQAIKAGGSVKVEAPGSLYKVDLPDEHIAKMLDWDKPLSQQAPNIAEMLRARGMSQEMSGKDVWETLVNSQKVTPLQTRPSGTGFVQYNREAPARATTALLDAGIPGIRYLDGGSRGAGQGTSNFVIFPQQEHLLTILERNGVPLR